MLTAARRGADAPWRAAQLLAGVIIAISFMTPAVRGEPVVLADPTLPLLQTWTHRRFVGATDYERTKLDGVAAIRAVGRDSASGLYRDVRYQVAAHPWPPWTWPVAQLQQTAEPRIKERGASATGCFFIFGRPTKGPPHL